MWKQSIIRKEPRIDAASFLGVESDRYYGGDIVTKVLVVGGAGYIGGAVTELLTAARVPFTVYDSLIYEPHYLKKLDFVRGDVRDTEKFKALLASYTHVIWLAAIVGDGACEVNPELTVEVNQQAVQWL